ncbi:MAG: RsmE family RNA methyltransferase [Verrucomicrobiia bacterium]
MNTHRFFLPPEAWTTPLPHLDAEESHHALHVLRLVEGQKITVFDGCGKEASARIVGVSRSGGSRVELKLGQTLATPRLRCEITLAQAIPKGRNMELIVQKATELGVARIVPLLSERAVVRLDDHEARAKQAKWRAVVIEAAKQCGQNWLPEVALPVSPKTFFAGQPHADLMLIGSLQSDALPLKAILAEWGGQQRPRSVIALIGPEGDFTPAELGMARSGGCRPLSLGRLVQAGADIVIPEYRKADILLRWLFNEPSGSTN